MIIKLNGCQCDLAIYSPTKAHLFSLRTDPQYRKQGAAKRLLRVVRKYAERKGMIVELGVGPFADAPMSFEQLSEFYSSMGYKHLDKWCMRLEPRKVKHAASSPLS